MLQLSSRPFEDEAWRLKPGARSRRSYAFAKVETRLRGVFPGWLHDGGLEEAPAKARNLARMAAAGLPVPPGWVFDPDRPPEPAALRAAAEVLLERGSVIVRAALRGEDEALGSAAGLGLSMGGCSSVDAVNAAVAAVDTHRRDPWAVRYRGEARDDRIVLQAQVPCRTLLVCAILPDRRVFAESYAGGDALEGGSTPLWAGRLGQWTDPARAPVQRLCEAIATAMSPEPHGLDAEIVVPPEGEPQVVQVRPLVEPLLERWEPFMTEVRRLGQADHLQGTLVLDAEHNPEPLSFAHAWLMRWLAHERPKSGKPQVLAGWLYVRTLVRDLSRAHPREPADPHGALERLNGELLPAARRRLQAIEARLQSSDREQVADTLPEALDAFASMIDVYLDVLVPARAVKRTRKEGDPSSPLSLRGREDFIDVLPTTWDIASPALGELTRIEARTPASDSPPEPIPEDPAVAATLLEEQDDHLFALGLAPLRRLWLRAGELLGMKDDVFHLEGPELARILRDPGALPPDLLASRAAQLAHWATLVPPPRIDDGEPVPVPPSTRLRGIPIGETHEGPVCLRSGIEDLLARPPSPGAIVVLPALTAQMAVALRERSIAAVCCEHGGALSHAALMARELGLSALIGCRGCTAVPEGSWARLDTRLARLIVLRRSGEG